MSYEYKKPGQDCTCHAYSEYECHCGADWTDPVIYSQRKQINLLQAQLLAAQAEIKELKNQITEQ